MGLVTRLRVSILHTESFTGFSWRVLERYSICQPIRKSPYISPNENRSGNLLPDLPWYWFSTSDLTLTIRNTWILWSYFFKSCACSNILVCCFSPKVVSTPHWTCGVTYLKPTWCSFSQKQARHSHNSAIIPFLKRRHISFGNGVKWVQCTKRKTRNKWIKCIAPDLN